MKKRRIDKYRDIPPQNPDQFWDQVLATWKDFAKDQNYFRDLVDSMPRKCQAVIDAGAMWMKYAIRVPQLWLSAIMLVFYSDNGSEFMVDKDVAEGFSQERGHGHGFFPLPLISNIYMEHFEEMSLSTASHKPTLWLRYVDDTFIIWPQGAQLMDGFLKHLNSLRPSIQFMMEAEQNKCILFLDVLVTRDQEKLATTVYRKSTHTGRYLHFESNHPTHIKRGIISTLHNRATSICNKESDLQDEVQSLTNTFTPFSRWTEGDERDVVLAGKPPAWLSRLRRLPAGLKLRSGAEVQTIIFEIRNVISMQVNTRYQDIEQLQFCSFANTSKFLQYSNIFPSNALATLQKTFPNLFKVSRLKSELELLYADHVYQNISLGTSTKTCKRKQRRIEETHRLFSLIVTLPSTSVSVERSFSALNRIKTNLRNSMAQGRLTSLACISIHKDLLHDLIKKQPFHDDISDNSPSVETDESI
ncbi:hypothetical protein ANN_15242 [Periplaneta americana]|uniref:HAT C-terminal dimerisation domain-containing protein n=1 Tax=Periplaneta americana TaxID=6978 RepID=A0ABQ8SFV8_PERAM|nr:hypothetical protein ANN_15242 [Periplaneta americana]